MTELRIANCERGTTRNTQHATYFLAGLLWTMLLLTACGATDANVAKPLPAQSRTFPATGFTVENEFLYFFDRYGGVESLGQPISGELNDGGWRVQYFEIGRLEYHPENAPEYRVTVGWLGDLLQRRQPPLAASSIPPVDAPNRRYFAKTGHTLNGDFLRYFDTNGGSVRFGLPISEPFLLEGQLTQDFQSARFFWTPAAESPVTLEAIGQTHLQQIQKNRPPE